MIGLKGRLWALLDTWQRSEFVEIKDLEFGKFGDRGISLEKGYLLMSRLIRSDSQQPSRLHGHN
jgi:hypothetical protein